MFNVCPPSCIVLFLFLQPTQICVPIQLATGIYSIIDNSGQYFCRYFSQSTTSHAQTMCACVRWRRICIYISDSEEEEAGSMANFERAASAEAAAAALPKELFVYIFPLSLLSLCAHIQRRTSGMKRAARVVGSCVSKPELA